MTSSSKQDVTLIESKGLWTARRGKFMGKGTTKGRAFINMLNIQKRAKIKDDEATRLAGLNRKPDDHVKED